MLPDLYARWTEQLFGRVLPEENLATCSSCVMLPPAGPAPPAPQPYFHPSTKCCTYTPELGNFLVGRVLGDDDPAMAEGRATVEARLASGLGVSPLGLMRPALASLLYEHGAYANEVFGRASSQRCPHYIDRDGGLCGVWRHRASVCATWYCKHERGAAGSRFWRALDEFLGAIERGLIKHCLLELDVGAAALRELVPRSRPGRQPVRLDADAIDGRANRARLRGLWGRWADREREFYRAAAQLVEPLTAAEVLALVGPEAGLHRVLAEAALAELDREELPATLRPGPLQLHQIDRRRVRVQTYSPFDWIDLPVRALDLLGRFDGRPTEVVMRVLAEAGAPLEPAEARRLIDYDILIDVGDR